MVSCFGAKHLMRLRIGKWNPLISAACGFFLSLRSLGTFPEGPMLLSAARGLSDIGTFGESNVLDRLAGVLWIWFGYAGLSFGSWMCEWILFSLVVFALLLLSSWALGGKWRGKEYISRGVPLFIALACLWSLWHAAVNWQSDRRDLRLLSPLSLAESAVGDGFKVFANPSMLPILALTGGDPLLKPDESARWSLSPSEWRAEQRSRQWDTVVLSGPLTEYRPLLNHLLISPDWRLTGLTNQGWVFKRGEGVPLVLPAVDSIEFGNTTETALYLAQLSAKFEAMGNPVLARASIERALDLAPREAEVRLHAANFAAARKRWQDVASHAKAALKASPRSATAYSLLALAMLESGDPSAARNSAQAALRVAPEDPGTLFLLARAQRNEKDYRSEAETLETLVATCRERGLPSAGYQAYLAQSYAQAGNAEGAAKNYREALASGQLDEVQNAAVREALEVVESHALPVSPNP